MKARVQVTAVSALSATGVPGGGLKATQHRTGSLGRLRRHFTPDRSKQVSIGSSKLKFSS